MRFLMAMLALGLAFKRRGIQCGCGGVLRLVPVFWTSKPRPAEPAILSDKCPPCGRCRVTLHCLRRCPREIATELTPGARQRPPAALAPQRSAFAPQAATGLDGIMVRVAWQAIPRSFSRAHAD